MRTLIASRRAVVATAVGLAMALSLGGCSQAPVRETVGCSLEQFHGDLVAEDGRPVFVSIQHNLPPKPVPLDLPDDWEIRATNRGQLEVLAGSGAVAATTGTRVIMLTDGDPNTPSRIGGAFVLCAISPYPMDLEVEVAP